MRRIRDNEGDVWDEQPDGHFKLTKATDPWDLGLKLPLGSIEESYGPVSDIVPDDSLVEFITELRELCDRWATKLGV